jgi:hypothetical protein
VALDDDADRAVADAAFKPNCLGIQTSINDTLLTPDVVPKSGPKTNLWLNHCALVGLPTRNNGCLPLGFADEDCNLARVLPGRRTATVGAPYLSRPSADQHRADSTTTKPIQRDLAHRFNRPFT